MLGLDEKYLQRLVNAITEVRAARGRLFFRDSDFDNADMESVDTITDELCRLVVRHCEEYGGKESSNITLADILGRIDYPYEEIDVYISTETELRKSMYRGAATDCHTMLDATVVALFPDIDYFITGQQKPVLCIGVTY